MNPGAALGPAAIEAWTKAFLAFGFMIPLCIAALAAGYILAHFAIARFNATILGIHVRHVLAKWSPTKFFPEDSADERLIVETIRKALASGKLKLKDFQ